LDISLVLDLLRHELKVRDNLLASCSLFVTFKIHINHYLFSMEFWFDGNNSYITLLSKKTGDQLTTIC
jgi:hypothetical protein